jgi:RNA-directed DNA polymerase
MVAEKLRRWEWSDGVQEGGCVKDDPKEETPASVPEGATQAGEVRARWPWAEPTVWTDRMLTTLETGVKGGKWFSLQDKAFGVRSLRAAFSKVKANGGSPGVDGVTIARFERNLEPELERLSQALTAGTYRPQALRRAWIPKPGSREKRPIGIPTVRDRVVQTALRFALEPIFEREFLDRSYGFRPGRSCRPALRRVWENLRGGATHVVDADLKSFFDSIPHDLIMRGLEEKVSDGKLLGLVRLFLEHGVMKDVEGWDPLEGTPQGGPLSPLLANVALHGLDRLAEASGCELVRYADDFVVLCKSGSEAESALATVRDWVERAGLRLHPDKTRIADYGGGESFEFLGYEFKKGKAFPRRKSVKKLRDKIRAHTPYRSGRSLAATIHALNPILRGWYGYFKHGYPTALRDVDGFVRRRLRAMLAGRTGGHRHTCPTSTRRWPNSFFRDAGLFSMEDAHVARSTLS